MPKRARAYWKGFLRLSLVSIGVEIYNAVESKADISFRQIHKPSGRRVNYEKVVQGIGKIDSADIVKGYEVDTDTYVTLEPEEIDAVKLESKKTIDLVQFVDSKQIDYRYFERPYFIAPADELAGEGYVVIREALRKTGKVGLAQVTISGREWLVAIAPLVGKKSGNFNPDKFEDHYATALKELIQDKLKGRKIVAHEETRLKGGNIVDLMEALKKSVGGQQPTKPKAGRSAKKRA